VSNAIQGDSSSYYYYDFSNDSIDILTYELRKWFDDFRNIIQKKKNNIKFIILDGITFFYHMKLKDLVFLVVNIRLLRLNVVIIFQMKKK